MVQPCSALLRGDRVKQYLIMCRSVTSAQRCSKVLERAMIRSTVIKAPRELSANGCAYALRLPSKLEEAVSLLRRTGLQIGRLFVLESGGGYEEVFI